MKIPPGRGVLPPNTSVVICQCQDAQRRQTVREGCGNILCSEKNCHRQWWSRKEAKRCPTTTCVEFTGQRGGSSNISRRHGAIGTHRLGGGDETWRYLKTAQGQRKPNNCLLYRENLMIEIVTIYVDENLDIVYKLALFYTLLFTDKYFATQSMIKLE